MLSKRSHAGCKIQSRGNQWMLLKVTWVVGYSWWEKGGGRWCPWLKGALRQISGGAGDVLFAGCWSHSCAQPVIILFITSFLSNVPGLFPTVPGLFRHTTHVHCLPPHSTLLPSSTERAGVHDSHSVSAVYLRGPQSNAYRSQAGYIHERGGQLSR